ncbi:MAG: hypothetical protein WCF98_10175 [Synechococcus sp. ELA057]
MPLRGPGFWRRRIGWLLLAQLLWIPLLLAGPWRGHPDSGPPEGEALPPAPSSFGRRSRPPSLGELLAPGAPGGGQPGLQGGQGSADGPSGAVVLLNRPRTAPESSVTPQNNQAKGAPAAAGHAEGRPAAASAQPRASQLLGGSLGLEELRGAASPQLSPGASGAGAGSGKSAQP